MTKLSVFVNSVVARLADVIEFSEAAIAAAPETQRKHLNLIIDTEEKLEMRVARALGVPYREFVEGKLSLAYEPEAEREVARRRVERKRAIQMRKRERNAALDLDEGFAA